VRQRTQHAAASGSVRLSHFAMATGDEAILPSTRDCDIFRICVVCKEPDKFGMALSHPNVEAENEPHAAGPSVGDESHGRCKCPFCFNVPRTAVLETKLLEVVSAVKCLAVLAGTRQGGADHATERWAAAGWPLASAPWRALAAALAAASSP
jgi:hypothetical protein